MTFLRPNVARSSLVAAFALAAVALLAACNSGGSEPDATCSGVTPGSTFKLVEPGKSVGVSCATFASYGQPGQSGEYEHSVELHLEGDVLLGFWFDSSLTAPATLDFSSNGEFGAELLDYRGFEGGPRSLCATPGGFPPNDVTGGTIVIESFTLGADGVLDDIKAKVDVSFAGCSVDAWSLSGIETLTVRGDI